MQRVDSGLTVQFDHRHRGLAQPVVGAADDRGTPHGRMAFQCGAHIVGHDLESATDDGLIGPSENPHESVGVDAGQVGGADPGRRRIHLRRFDFQQTALVGPEWTTVLVHHAQPRARVGAAHAAAFVGPVSRMGVERPARHATTEFGCGIRCQDGNAELLGERVGIVGRQWCGSGGDDPDAGQVVARELGMQHHAQRSGYERHRPRPVFPHRGRPPAQVELG